MIPGSQFLPRSLRKTHTQHHGGFCGGKTSENLFSSENIITIIIVVVVIVAHTHWGGTIRGCGPCTGVQSLRRRVLRAVVLTPTEKPTPTPLLDELNERRTKVHTASGNVGCCTFIFRDFGLRCGAFWGVGMLDEKKGVGRIGGGGWVTGNSLLWGRFSRLCGVGGWAVVGGFHNYLLLKLGKKIFAITIILLTLHFFFNFKINSAKTILKISFQNIDFNVSHLNVPPMLYVKRQKSAPRSTYLRLEYLPLWMNALS